MLVKSNIQHALVDIPILSPLQAIAITITVGWPQNIYGAVYQSPSKLLIEDNFEKLIGLSKRNKFIFGATSIVNTRIGILNCHEEKS